MNDKPEPDERVPPLHLEQAALGERELPGRDDEVQALRDDSAAILEAHPPARVAAQIRARAGDDAARVRWWALPALAVPIAAAAAVLVVVLTPLDDSGIREKGARPHLVVETASGPLLDGDRAAAGTKLQLSYVASGARFGVVLSVDGAGRFTQHLPRAGDDAVALAEGKTSLPSAFVLDAAPGFERFYLVTHDAGFRVKDARRAIDAETPELVVTPFTVTK